jgi:cyclophilin family peptidyl-prolyl cis-trans isomerase
MSMLDLKKVGSLPSRLTTEARAKRRRGLGRVPGCEGLEDRRLMTASLQAIAPVTVPALQGTTIPLLAANTSSDAQNFTVTSSNPDISVSTAAGPFWNVGVSYSDPANPSTSFTGTLTFDLFGKQTPNTVNKITEFTNDDFYVNSGMYFPRVVSNFDGPGTTVIQGGSTNNEGTGSSGQAGTPFANENSQALALTGTDQLALANAGGTDTNDTQFFINTGSVNGLGYNYTVFGQLVAGQSTLSQMAAIPVQANSATGEDSQPVYPLKITSTSLSTTDANGAVIIDATQAKPGETATITVTATDPTDGSSTVQTFPVTVGAYSGPTTESSIGNVNFKPYAAAVSGTAYVATPLAVQLVGTDTYPDKSVSVPLSYALASQPEHGTVTDFNPATGRFLYTAAPGYSGPDSFTYTVTANGPNAAAGAATSNPATVTINDTLSPAPLATVKNVSVSDNGRGELTNIVVTFSQPVNATQADDKSAYRLAKGHATIRLKSAVYSPADQAVLLTLRQPYKITKPVELTVDGTGTTAIEDSLGREIDGANTGTAGSNAVITINKKGSTSLGG